MAKHTNGRKAAAVGLGVVGVAGLSLAAASTLTVDTQKEIAIGSDTFAACDTDGVAVDYDYAKSGSTYEITDVTVSGIDATCVGEAITLALADKSGTELFNETGSVTGASFVYDASGDNIPVATDLGDVTVIISD